MKFLYFLILSFGLIQAHKILIFSPTISRSHMISNGHIADELAQDENNVTLLEVEFLIKSTDFRGSKYANIISMSGFQPDSMTAGIRAILASAFNENQGAFDNLRRYDMWQDIFNGLCDSFLQKHKETLEKLKEENFDAIFTEQLNLCGTGLKEVLGIKTHFWVSSTSMMDHMSWILGVPAPLSYVPVVGELDISDRPTYYERVWNIIEYFGYVRIFLNGARATTEIYRKHYGPSFPDVDQIARDSPITFVMADEILDFPRPIMHNIIYIGGLGVKNEVKDLTEPFKTEMSKGRKGVVYFSLGSAVNTNLLPKEVKKNIFEAFERLEEYHFLVKVDKGDQDAEKYAKNTSNVFIFQWAPQPEILSHPNLKAFITHGGYNSLIEAGRAGIPIVTIPFFGDQFRNGRVADRNGWGLTFNKKKLLHGHEEFLETLKKILDDNSYTLNAQRTKHLLKTKPFSSSEKLVGYTKFALENGGLLPELQSEGRNLSFFVYYNLDIFGPLLLVALLMVYVELKLFVWVFISPIIHGTPKKVVKKLKKH